MNDIERRIAYETSRFLALAGRAGLPVGKRAPAPARSAPAPRAADLPDGRSQDLRWLPSDWRAKAGPPVVARTQAALDRCAPKSARCPACGSSARAMSGFIDNYPLHWCGACGQVRNQRW